MTAIPQWEDASSWSQKDTAETKAVPRTWKLRFPHITITVTRHVHYEPTDWLVSVNPPLFATHLAPSTDVEQVKHWAVLQLKNRLRETLRDLDRISSQHRTQTESKG